MNLTFIGEKREDGSVYVSSSELPLFHYVVPSSEKNWMESKELDYIIRETCRINNIEIKGTIVMENF